MRILDREDYGTYSIAVTVTMFLLALNDLAVGYAITRYQGDDVDELAGTAATVALGLSLCLYGIVFVTAPAIVALFNPPAGSPAVGVVRLAALAIVIDGTIAAPTGLITRALQEKIRVTCELVGFGFSTVLLFASGVRRRGGVVARRRPGGRCRHHRRPAVRPLADPRAVRLGALTGAGTAPLRRCR